MHQTRLKTFFSKNYFNQSEAEIVVTVLYITKMTIQLFKFECYIWATTGLLIFVLIVPAKMIDTVQERHKRQQ